MALGTFTRGSVETQAQARLKDILDAFGALERLRSRMAAELAAGTLDDSDFYPTSNAQAQTDKANIMGALDDLHAVYRGLLGDALPTLDYMRYASFLL